MATILLEIITQEAKILTEEVDQVTAPAVLGEVTILPGHIPLFTKLSDGLITIKSSKGTTEIAVLDGFMDVSVGNRVTILADSAIRAESVNIAKATEAKRKAEEAMHQKTSEIEFKQTEAALRKAILELKVAQRHRATKAALPSSE